MKVVMLVHNDMGSDARVIREASTLASAGHTVVVLALRGTGLPVSESRDGFEIRRVADTTRASWRSPRQKIAESRAREDFMVAEAIALQPDVIHCHDTDTLPAGARVAEATGARWVYDAHELFPDMVAGHRRGGLAASYWRRVEKRLVPAADAVITVNGARARVLDERYGVHPEIVRSVPDLEPIARTGRLRQELDIEPDTSIVLYQGGLMGGRALDRLVRAMGRVPKGVLVMQGFGELDGELREIVVANDLGRRVLFGGFVPPETLHEYACGADVGVVIYEPTSLNNYYAAPNKLWSYMMAGLPMVACDFPGLRAVIEGEGIGELFNPGSEVSIAAAINAVLGDPEARARMGGRSRRLAETRFNWGRESQVLLALYERLERERAEGGR